MKCGTCRSVSADNAVRCWFCSGDLHPRNPLEPETRKRRAHHIGKLVLEELRKASEQFCYCTDCFTELPAYDSACGYCGSEYEHRVRRFVALATVAEERHV